MEKINSIGNNNTNTLFNNETKETVSSENTDSNKIMSTNEESKKGQESNNSQQTSEVLKCGNPKCSKAAGNLRCPSCKKFGLKENSFFCSKECFTSCWSTHKKQHEECKIPNLNFIFY